MVGLLSLMGIDGLIAGLLFPVFGVCRVSLGFSLLAQYPKRFVCVLGWFLRKESKNKSRSVHSSSGRGGQRGR